MGAVLALGWLPIVLWGCGDDGGDDRERGRGSAACQDWQDAICDFAADMCGGVSREQCDRQYRGFECETDAKASECANMLNDASCGSAAQCDWRDVANTRPAVEKCGRLVEAICGYEVRCGGADAAECMGRRELELGDCSLAIGATMEYESCLQTVESAPCAKPLDLQSACGGVLFFSQ